jgi:hypothetical protein
MSAGRLLPGALRGLTPSARETCASETGLSFIVPDPDGTLNFPGNRRQVNKVSRFLPADSGVE